MTILQAIILGAVQGVTEFLPVSSSGHLAILQKLFNLSEIPVLFDVLLHVSTLLVVIIVFRTIIGKILLSIFRFIARRNDDTDRENLRLFLVVVLATAVTAVVGLLLSRFHLEQKTRIISLLFIATGVILLITRFVRGNKTYGQLGVKEGLITGFAQGLGVLPGISRSGITISAALYSGMSREKAGEFSFLISIPAIIGAFILSLKDAGALSNMVSTGVLALGIVVSFVVGLLSLLLLLRLLRKGRLYFFAIYLIPLGILTFFLL